MDQRKLWKLCLENGLRIHYHESIGGFGPYHDSCQLQLHDGDGALVLSLFAPTLAQLLPRVATELRRVRPDILPPLMEIGELLAFCAQNELVVELWQDSKFSEFRLEISHYYGNRAYGQIALGVARTLEGAIEMALGEMRQREPGLFTAGESGQ